MIRLRSELERALANPWLRYVVIFLLVGLIALVFLHVIEHGVHGDAALLLCLAVAALLRAVVPSRQSDRRPMVASPWRRGPPLRTRATRLNVLAEHAAIPLRR